MHNPTLGTESIRAFFTLQCCWLNSEEIYLEQGCLHCGSAATYLIYFTNRHIQDLLLNFIAKYRCHHAKRMDLQDIETFADDYEQFLEHLEKEVNHYARKHHEDPRHFEFETVESIFEREFRIAC